MEKAYAQALWKAIESGVAPENAVRALRESLRTHGRDALLPRIARAFAKHAQEAQRRATVVVAVAKEGDVARATSAAQALLEKKGDNSGIRAVVDDTLIGGWRIEGKETLVDASYKHSLLELFKKATA